MATLDEDSSVSPLVEDLTGADAELLKERPSLTACPETNKLVLGMSQLKLLSELEEDSMPKITKFRILDDDGFPDAFSLSENGQETDKSIYRPFDNPIDPIDLEHVNNSFVTDPETIELLRKSKVMFILRGIPGSGKSSICSALQFVYKDIVRCSASDYFWRTGEYQSTRTREDQIEAHKACQQTAEHGCRAGNIVVVDNCHVHLWEMSFYLNLAKEHNYITLVAEPETPWKNDAAVSADRIDGAVDVSIIQKKLEAWQKYVPKFFAWYINAVDTKQIYEIANDFYRQCYQIPEIREVMMSYGLTEDPTANYSYNYSASGQPDAILYCVSFYSNFGQKVGADKFADSPMLRRAYGRVSDLRIVGLIMTSDCFLVRVMLDDEQMNLVNHRLNTPTPPGSRPTGNGNWRSVNWKSVGTAASATGGADVEGQSARQLSPLKSLNSSELCGTADGITCRWTDATSAGSNPFPCYPDNSYSTNQCRAHMLLGTHDLRDCAQNAISDVQFLIMYESGKRRAKGGRASVGQVNYPLSDGATVVDYGSEALAVYFKRHLLVRAVLASSSEAPVRDRNANRRPSSRLN